MNAKQRRKYSRFVSRNITDIIENGLDEGLDGVYYYKVGEKLPEIYIHYYAIWPRDMAYVKIPAFYLINKNFRNSHVKLKASRVKPNSFRYAKTAKLEYLENIPIFKKVSISECNEHQLTYFLLPQFKIETNEDCGYDYVFAEGHNSTAEPKFIIFRSPKNSSVFSYHKALANLEEILEDPAIDSKTKMDLVFNLDILQNKANDPDASQD